MIRPWEAEPERYSYPTRHHGTANCVREPIEDVYTTWKRGDIVKFGTGYFGSYDYKDWFLTNEDKALRYSRDKRIPLYAINEYAVLIIRYRVVKNKHGHIFRDYGSHIMMLTGSKIGKMRRYYSCIPFELVDNFPYKRDDNVAIDILTHHNVMDEANALYSVYGNSPETRTLFVTLLQNKLCEVNE